MKEGWPIYFQKNLILGEEQSGYGIATLWTEKETVLTELEPKHFCIGGQLYSKIGINFILRNVLAHPIIKRIIICGQDKSGSGEALINLKKNGINQDHEIIGSQNAPIHKEIPAEAVELFRKNVEILDFRGEASPEKIRKEIERVKIDATPFAESQIFPEPEVLKPNYFPSEKIGIRIEARKVSIAWLKVLQHIMKFGYERPSHYSDKQKELLHVNTIITDENPDKPDLAQWFDFSEEEYINYLPQIMTAQQIPNVNYTYGQRLRDHEGINQIEESIIRRLKKESFTRRAVAVSWNVKTDYNNEHCPCLDLIQCLVQDKKIYMSCYLRSNDMYRAFPRNALAFRKMQKEIADAAELELGYLNVISASAHIYEENYEAVTTLLEKYGDRIPPCEWDPRGNFIIEVDGDIIRAIQNSPDGVEIDRYEGSSASEVYRQLSHNLAVGIIGHALDLGAQLQNAEIALKLGIKFTQDRPLPLKELPL